MTRVAGKLLCVLLFQDVLVGSVGSGTYHGAID